MNWRVGQEGHLECPVNALRGEKMKELGEEEDYEKEREEEEEEKKKKKEEKDNSTSSVSESLETLKSVDIINASEPLTEVIQIISQQRPILHLQKKNREEKKRRERRTVNRNKETRVEANKEADLPKSFKEFDDGGIYEIVSIRVKKYQSRENEKEELNMEIEKVNELVGGGGGGCGGKRVGGGRCGYSGGGVGGGSRRRKGNILGAIGNEEFDDGFEEIALHDIRNIHELRRRQERSNHSDRR